MINNLLVRVTDRIRFFFINNLSEGLGGGRAHGSACVGAPYGHNGQPERTGPPAVCRSPPGLHFPAGAALGARTVRVASGSRPYRTLPPSHPMVFRHGITGTARGLCGERTRSPSSSCTGPGPASFTPPPPISSSWVVETHPSLHCIVGPLSAVARRIILSIFLVPTGVTRTFRSPTAECQETQRKTLVGGNARPFCSPETQSPPETTSFHWCKPHRGERTGGGG
jgi:hypothetical protein